MGNLIAEAFVKLNTSTNISLIPKALKKVYNCYVYDDCDQIWVIMKGVFYSLPLKRFVVDINFIDCNYYANRNEDLAMALFLALAEMRDDTDKNQWFITEVDQAWVNLGMYCPKGSFEKCLVEDRTYGGKCENITPARKATPLELAEAVKSGVVSKEQLTNK